MEMQAGRTGGSSADFSSASAAAPENHIGTNPNTSATIATLLANYAPPRRKTGSARLFNGCLATPASVAREEATAVVQTCMRCLQVPGIGIR